ncbi:MAG TPA: FAD-dependent oxidoreductase [Acidimicrobiales bacterium]
MTTSPTITIVGGGIAGLVASIACAEAGARDVHLLEAHPRLGGRAATTEGPWRANLGPHALYTNTGLWAWLAERDLLPPVVRPQVSGLRFRWRGARRATPPAALLRSGHRARALRSAPVDRSLREWLSALAPEPTVEAVCSAAGVLTFDHDPGRLSAAFVAERIRRFLLQPKTVARYVVGGWSNLVDTLAAGARARGVRIETGARVDALPESGPVIVSTPLDAARRLTGDDGLRVTGTRTVLLDVGLRARRDDPAIASDLDEAGWADRFSATDPGLAPDGHQLVQCHMGARPDEDLGAGVARVERLLDDTFRGWREREVWRRRSIVDGLTGAIDPPGTTWRDRPAIDRGDGVFLCGDQVAAPGHLAEIAWASACEAARLAVAQGASRLRVANSASSRLRRASHAEARKSAS